MLQRREFIRGAGLTAAIAVITGVEPLRAGATPTGVGAADGVVAALRGLTLDTFRGVATFMYPGRDRYSAHQGTVDRTPGALQENSGETLVGLFDRYIPQGDQLTRPIVVALASSLSDFGVRLDVDRIAPGDYEAADSALGFRDNPRTFPSSVIVAILLNLSTLLVDPVVTGPFSAPFANLDLRGKAKVFELLEQPAPALLAFFDTALPEPLRGSGSGVLKFLSGIILDGAAFAVYSEQDHWNRFTRTLTGRPVAWDLTSYRPRGPQDGHDDFIGYHRGMQVWDA